jgi:iron(III) transport system substrate-binding protein
MKSRRWIVSRAAGAALGAPAVLRIASLFGPAGLATGSFAQARPPSWLSPELLAKAKAEGGTITVYSSVNEQEALPLWKDFEEPTGIKVEYVRASDTALIGRIALEARAQQRSWDVLVTTAVGRLPQDFLVPFEPVQAKDYPKEAFGPGNRWYGVYSNICAPSYNTKHIDPAKLPKTYEEFANRAEWSGRVAIDVHDEQWLIGQFRHHGEAKARKILGDIADNLKPTLVDGHLALARQVGLGEYWVTVSNYINLTNNVRMRGSPTDFWVIDPLVVIYGAVGISARAPRPNTARLAAEFLMSREGQQKLTHAGRIPVRQDVTPNPPDVWKRLEGHKLVPVNLTGDQEKKATADFNAIFRKR